MAATMRRTITKLLTKHSEVSVLCTRNLSTNENNILTSVYKNIEPVNVPLHEFLWTNLEKWPNKTVAVCGVTGRSYTYSQTYKMSTSLAASFRNKLKLKPNDAVAVVLPNMPEYPCVMLGIVQAGCIVTTVNPIYTSNEIKIQLQMLDCKAIVSTKLSYQAIAGALQLLQRDIPIIIIDDEVPEGCIKFSEFTDTSIDTTCLKSVRRSPDDIAIIPFSSGTTGMPKGVVLTHSNVVAINQMISDPEIIAVDETTETHQSVLPAVLPFFHIFGMNVLMMSQMYLGCKMVTMPYFKPDLFLKVLVDYKGTSLFVVPPMAVFLGKHPSVTPAHLASLKSIVCGAAPLSEADADALTKKNNKVIIRQGYGLTETSGALCIGRNTDTNHASVGHALPNCEVKIADLHTGEALSAGQEGEIWFRGPVVMKGYYNNEGANEESFHGGWFKTGDIGKYDENKYIYVTDRLKELIKVKGFQVPPAELEAVLRTHPKVLDSAVIGIPDPISGEKPKAFVVPQPGQNPSEDEIKQYVNSKLISYKNIHKVQFVENIPKNAAGKILRKDLKNMCA